jgi:phenylalanyl-tRNA synthetase beta chain
MVSVDIRKKDLEKLVGRHLKEEQLREALPMIKCGIESIEEGVISLEVTGDRPDLLCVEGVAQALKGFLGIEKGIPALKVSESGMKLVVEKSVLAVRPYIACASIKGAHIDEDYFKDLIQIQEKLHLTHGRKRRRVAIGIHDAAPIKPDFIYKAVDPHEISFVPLAKTEKMNLAEIMEKHEKGREYAFTLEGKKKYPIILDSNNNVLSFPPIINNSLTEVSTKTKNLFLDVTGDNFDAVSAALNILVQGFFDRGAKVESVRIEYPDKTITTPITSPHKMQAGKQEVNKLLGLNLSGKEIADCLGRQRIDALAEGEFIAARIPCYRADFIHPIDLVEEAAIGYDIGKLEPKEPHLFTVGAIHDNTALVSRTRDALVGAGFLELSTYVITNEKILEKAKSCGKKIAIGNPVSADYTIVREEIIPNLLGVLSENTHHDYPQKIFEVGEVVERNEEAETKTDTGINACAVSAHASANLTEIASALDFLLKSLRVEYKLKKPAKNLERFIVGRQAEIIAGGEKIGEIGELRPAVLNEFGLSVPCASFEIKLG